MICGHCKEDKPTTAFSKSLRAKSGFQTYCKPCIRGMDTTVLQSARYRRYQEKWPAKTTRSFIKQRARRMGVAVCSLAEFTAWFDSQTRRCAYCGISEQESKERFAHKLHIDRKENSLGYIPVNMALACHRCNVVKNAYLTHDQMMFVAEMFFKGTVNSHAIFKTALEEIALGNQALARGIACEALRGLATSLERSGGAT